MPQLPQFEGSVVTLLHPLEQHDSPSPHAGPPAHAPVQWEFTHDPPFPHAFPHAPQFLGSLVVSMHPSVLQHVWPTPQLQIGLLQDVPPWGSSVQHCPSMHVSGDDVEQAKPHPPQLFGSLVVSMHAAPQQESPGEHPETMQPFGGATHVPLLQESPGGQGKPQLPQLFGSLVVSVQPSAQQLSSPGQPVDAQVTFGGVQPPLMHEEPVGHTFPQAPQFSGSKLMFAVQASLVGPPSPATH
jgi:hypothetical protein